MFSDLVFCADCGSKMNYGSTNNYKPQQAFFDCSLHWKDKEKCSTHYIRESVLERLVLHHIQMVTEHILHHKDYFVSVMGQQMRLESSEKIQIHRKKLGRNQKRIAELKRLFIKIYEDNAAGRLSDERFDMMRRNRSSWKRKRRLCNRKLKYRNDSMRTSSFSSRRPTSMWASRS